MKYQELTENCKRAIAENRCLGCVGLAEKDWISPKKCPYLPSAEESIKQIKLNLRNGEKMKHIVSFSGGKDSTAMLLRMLEENMQVDEILFCDTGKDFPDMIEHIEQVKKYIKEKYNKEIITLKAEKSFDYYMFEHEKTRGKNKGKKGYGWATMFCRWCTSNLKNRVIDNHLKKYKQEGYKEYIGIAFDEPKRIKDKNYPLVDWKMTEADCLKYCYDRGFTWNGLYEHFDRLSCWCCPLKNLKELKILYMYYPDLWQELKEMDKRSYNQFRADYSIEQLEEKFKKELKNTQIDLLENLY